MRIDGVGPQLPLSPIVAAPGAAAATGAQSITSLVNQQLIQEEQKGGGGGGRGGHGGPKKALDAIDDIAARASLKLARGDRTMLDRMREIDKLKAELAAEGEKVGEKQTGERDERESGQPDQENDAETAG